MALKRCKECGKEVSTKAESCPNCGAVLRKKAGCLTSVVGVIFVLIILAVIVAVISEDSATPSSKPEAGFKMPSVGEEIVTFDEYQRIHSGMSYRQVVQVIGAQGEEMSRNTMEGAPGVMESVETVMYQWVNNNGSNMNAMFQNDELIQKAQFGLR